MADDAKGQKKNGQGNEEDYVEPHVDKVNESVEVTEMRENTEKEESVKKTEEKKEELLTGQSAESEEKQEPSEDLKKQDKEEKLESSERHSAESKQKYVNDKPNNKLAKEKVKQLEEKPKKTGLQDKAAEVRQKSTKERPKTQKKKHLLPVKLGGDLGISSEALDSHGSRFKTSRKYASTKELMDETFYEELLATGFSSMNEESKTEHNRVVYLLGDSSDKSLKTKERKACALGILKACDHTDAFLVDSSWSTGKSVLSYVSQPLLKELNSVKVEVCKEDTEFSDLHKSTIVLTDVRGEDEVEKLVKAKQNLALGLAGGSKIVVLWIGQAETPLISEELKQIKERQWPVLTLHHIRERDFDMSENICKFPKANISSAELASFIHIHLTIDIFNM